MFPSLSNHYQRNYVQHVTKSPPVYGWLYTLSLYNCTPLSPYSVTRVSVLAFKERYQILNHNPYNA